MEFEAMRDRIRRFVEGRFPAARGAKDGDPLLRNGVVDSLGVLDVVAFLEREFGIAVVDDDLTAENFESLQAMASYTRAKQGGSLPGKL